MKKPLAITALAGLAAAGILAALALAPAALAWSPNDLPPSWTVSHTTNVGATYCHDSYTIFTVGHAEVSSPFCTDSPTYQADFDAWVDARYTPPTTAATTTGPTTTTTAPSTTTAATTTTQPPPPPPATTVTVTVTTDATTQIDALTARITALEQQIAALSTRVDRIALAGDASWLAYQQAVAAGDTPDIAAGIARGTWMNAVYGLGAFAP